MIISPADHLNEASKILAEIDKILRLVDFKTI